MSKRLSVEVKELMVELAGACFWYWNSFFSFLDSAGVESSHYKRYPREVYNKYQAMRSIITDLENTGDEDTVNALISQLYRLRGPIDRDNLDPKKAKTLLAEFRSLVGNDPIEAAIREQGRRAARAAHQKQIEERELNRLRLQDLNSRFLSLASGATHTPQQRGFCLERLFFDLLHITELEHTKPYRTPGGEQIDGHLRYEKFDYLVEVKWIEGLVKQEHLSVFDGKIRGKAQSTRGLFLAANGFDPKAVLKFTGDSPRILLMTGEDLALVLAGTVDFYDLLRAKVDALVRHGVIDLPAREV